MTTHHEIEDSALLRAKCPLLAEAAAYIGESAAQRRLLGRFAVSREAARCLHESAIEPLPLLYQILALTDRLGAAAATRVWAAAECLKKAAAMVDVPLTLRFATADGWVVLAAGSFLIATFVASVRGMEERLVLAVLGRGDHARL